MTMTERTRRTPTRPEFPDPYNDSRLLNYLQSVAAWHGYVRFLGLPDLQENPDTPHSELFVEPFLHARHVRPDEPPAGWAKGRVRTIDLLRRHQRLLVLGDPGSGKSTLLNWIAWSFTRWDAGEWVDTFGPLVPVPVVIRDLPIGRDVTWDKLVAAVLNHGVARDLLTRAALDDLVARGQALFLVDGLDEISDRETRETLRAVLLDAMAGAAGTCPWLLTSRVVGYDEVSYDRTAERDPEELAAGEPPRPRAAATRSELREHAAGRASLHRCFVCPFDDDQVGRFARLWYASRMTQGRAFSGRTAGDFLRNLRAAAAPAALARIPNLLTLFALVYRVYAEIPHGRSVLYAKVAEAYLESIDKSRGMKPRFQRDRMERWLAFLGFRMQLRRAEQDRRRAAEERDILVPRAELERLLTEDMAKVGRHPTADEAREFVDFAARRSGLLLPRGEGQFAFMHLSFQEFFAARFLMWQLMSPKWRDGRTYPGTDGKSLKTYSGSSVWTETLVLLFELLKEEPDHTEVLRECLFGARYSLTDEKLESTTMKRADLLAEILIDPHTGLTDDERDRDLPAFVEWEVARQQRADFFHLGRETPFARLLNETGYQPEARWQFLGLAFQKLRASHLSLFGCTGVSDLAPVGHLAGLQHLSLFGCTGVSDLAPVGRLAGLQYLYLTGCTGVSDLAPVGRLAGLQTLSLTGCTGVSDFDPIRNKPGLTIFGLPASG